MSDTEDKAYKKIANALMLPKGMYSDLIKILKFWFTPEEAKIVSVFRTSMMDSFPVEKIAKKTKEPVEKVQEILDKLTKKGLIFTWLNKKLNKKMYTIPMLFPGLFEWYFASKNNSMDELRKAAKVFLPLESNFMSMASRYPISRVVPSIRPLEKTKTIEINQDVEAGKGRILVFEDVKQILEKSWRIGVMPCPCRTFHGILGDACDKPIDVCFNLNSSADYVIKEGIGREVTVEEGLEILKMAEEAGLVHVVNNQSDKFSFICNCCNDCCGFLGTANKYKLIDKIVAKSNFFPKIDHDKCKRCKRCIKMCPVNAIFLSFGEKEDLSDSFITVREDLCIGCGVCAANCAWDAITLEKVRDVKEDDLETKIWEAGARSRKEKIF
ncbi:MAG: ATP-binding protein [Candidatus Helarchaeota archaeon]